MFGKNWVGFVTLCVNATYNMVGLWVSIVGGKENENLGVTFYGSPLRRAGPYRGLFGKGKLNGVVIYPSVGYRGLVIIYNAKTCGSGERV